MSTAETLPTSWRVIAAALCWLLYLPVALTLWGKAHLPLHLMIIPLGVMFLFLAVPLGIVAVRKPRSRYVGLCLVVLTHYLLVILALTLFSIAEAALRGPRYAALATALASAAAWTYLLLTRRGREVVDASLGRVPLKVRPASFLEIAALFALYTLSLSLR
jgi:hypothetical protein